MKSQEGQHAVAIRYVDADTPVFPCHSNKHPVTDNGFHGASLDREQIDAWWGAGQNHFVAFPTGEKSGISVLDVDVKNDKDGLDSLDKLAEAHGGLEAFLGLTHTVMTQSGGLHFYFNHRPGLKNSAGKLGDGLDIRADGGYVIAEGNQGYRTLEDRNVADMPDWLADLAKQAGGTRATKINPTEVKRDYALREGTRNDGIIRVVGALRNLGFSVDKISDDVKWFNEEYCDPKLPALEINTLIRQGAGFPLGLAGLENVAQPLYEEVDADKPPKAGRDFFYGPVGKMVRAIGKETEADPVAIHAQILIAVSTAIGRGPFYQIDEDMHRAHEFIVIVGKTGEGGKGQSKSFALETLKVVDPSLRVRNGLSTGEGLINMLRDIEDIPPGGGEKRVIGEWQDKRMLAISSELSRVLAVKGRESNTLSSVLREAWDGGTLENNSVVNKMRATDPHLSVIAHITKEELDSKLATVEMANGFGNRFLWFHVKRGPKQPRGGKLDRKKIEGARRAIKEAVRKAREIEQVTWHEETYELWDDFYCNSNEYAGLLQGMMARRAAHTARIALMYAILDGESKIRLPHLKAAIAMWEYNEKSILHIFKGRTGDSVADLIVEALEKAPDKTMTKTELHKVVPGRGKAGRIDGALAVLGDRIKVDTKPTKNARNNTQTITLI